MKSEVVSKLKEELIADFAKSLENNNAIGAISEILEGNAKDNAHSEDGQTQETSITLKPSIRIEYTSPGAFAIKASINIKNIKAVTGEAESSFDCNQPELPLDGPSKDDLDGEGDETAASGKAKRGRKPKAEQTAA